MIFKEEKMLVSWVARNQELDQFPISFALFFDENDIVKLGIDHAVCEEIAATDGQLLLK